MRPGDLATAVTATEIDPIVESPLRAIDTALEGARGEAGQPGLAYLGVAVTVAVGQENDIRCQATTIPSRAGQMP